MPKPSVPIEKKKLPKTPRVAKFTEPMPFNVTWLMKVFIRWRAAQLGVEMNNYIRGLIAADMKATGFTQRTAEEYVASLEAQEKAS